MLMSLETFHHNFLGSYSYLLSIAIDTWDVEY
jgi:hypothetical protein